MREKNKGVEIIFSVKALSEIVIYPKICSNTPKIKDKVKQHFLRKALIGLKYSLSNGHPTLKKFDNCRGIV